MSRLLAFVLLLLVPTARADLPTVDRMQDLLKKSYGGVHAREAQRKLSEIRHQLIVTLGSSDSREVNTALHLVGVYWFRDAIPALTTIVNNHPSANSRNLALSILMNMGFDGRTYDVLKRHAAEVYELLPAHFGKPPKSATVGILSWTAENPRPEAAQILGTLLLDERELVRAQAVSALGQMRFYNWVSMVLPLANDASSLVRKRVAEALSYRASDLPRVAVLSACKELLKRSYAGFFEQIAAALFGSNTAEGVTLLATYAKSDKAEIARSAQYYLWYSFFQNDETRPVAEKALRETGIPLPQDHYYYSANNRLWQDPAFARLVLELAIENRTPEERLGSLKQIVEQDDALKRGRMPAPPTLEEIAHDLEEIERLAREWEYPDILQYANAKLVGKNYFTRQWPIVSLGNGRMFVFEFPQGLLGVPKPFGYGFGFAAFGENFTLLAARSLHNRGLQHAAEMALVYELDIRPTDYTDDGTAMPRNLLKNFAESAFAYFGNQIQDSSKSLEWIYSKLKVIQDSGLLLPDATDETSQRFRYHEFMDRLRQSLVPNTAPKGSIDWCINDLVNSTMEGARFSVRYDERIQRLREIGMRAVPNAIEHLGDKRITRAMFLMSGPTPTMYFTLDDLVANFLAEFSGGGIVRDDDGKMTKENALSWWGKNKNLSEEQYLVANAVTPPMSWGGSSLALNQMLAKTYPYRLREVYARALREKSWSASNIVEAIASSQLPRSRKIDDLMLGVETSFGWTAALKQLRKVDEQLASRLVVEGVRNGKELKLREIVGFANEWRIDELWNLLLERTKSADVGERLWSVFSVRRQGRSKNLFAGQKRYLLTMLDDATPAPDQKNNDEHNLQCYSVQNLAARVIGEQLGLPKAPMPRYSAEKWAVYRDVARKAIT